MRRILKLLHVRTSILRSSARSCVRRDTHAQPRFLFASLTERSSDHPGFASDSYKFDIALCLSLTSIDEEEFTLLNPANVSHFSSLSLSSFYLSLSFLLSLPLSLPPPLLSSLALVAPPKSHSSLSPAILALIIIVYLCHYMYNLWTQRVALFSRRLVNII